MLPAVHHGAGRNTLPSQGDSPIKASVTVLARPLFPLHCQGRATIYLLLAVTALAAGVTTVWVHTCPCERIPGSYLTGKQIEEPVVDWTFANRVQLCQIQTNSGVIPHAINLNCAADADGNLFLSCGQCEEKRWSKAAIINPYARIRLNGLVYPVILRKIETSSELDIAWRSRALKLMILEGEATGEISQRPDHWWSFQAISRS